MRLRNGRVIGNEAQIISNNQTQTITKDETKLNENKNVYQTLATPSIPIVSEKYKLTNEFNAYKENVIRKMGLLNKKIFKENIYNDIHSKLDSFNQMIFEQYFCILNKINAKSQDFINHFIKNNYFNCSNEIIREEIIPRIKQLDYEYEELILCCKIFYDLNKISIDF